MKNENILSDHYLNTINGSTFYVELGQCVRNLLVGIGMMSVESTMRNVLISKYTVGIMISILLISTFIGATSGVVVTAMAYEI